MKREILFKAKIQSSKSDWVEGFFVNKREEGAVIITDKGVQYEVDPETVGQLTEFTAKSRRLFVGDVIATRHFSGELVEHVFVSVYQIQNLKYIHKALCTQEWIDQLGFEFSRNIHDTDSN